MFYIDAYLMDDDYISAGKLPAFKEGASKFDEHEMLDLFRKFLTYLDDLGDDEVIIIAREFN